MCVKLHCHMAAVESISTLPVDLLFVMLDLCHKSLQLSTGNPWTIDLPRPKRNSSPVTAQLHIPRIRPLHPSWEPPSLAFSLDQHIFWWRPNPASPQRTSSPPSLCQGLDQQSQVLNPGFGWEGALDPDVVGDRVSSDVQSGHTAFVDALVLVPAAAGIG